MQIVKGGRREEPEVKGTPKNGAPKGGGKSGAGVGPARWESEGGSGCERWERGKTRGEGDPDDRGPERGKAEGKVVQVWGSGMSG